MQAQPQLLALSGNNATSTPSALEAKAYTTREIDGILSEKDGCRCCMAGQLPSNCGEGASVTVDRWWAEWGLLGEGGGSPNNRGDYIEALEKKYSSLLTGSCFLGFSREYQRWGNGEPLDLGAKHAQEEDGTHCPITDPTEKVLWRLQQQDPF